MLLIYLFFLQFIVELAAEFCDLGKLQNRGLLAIGKLFLIQYSTFVLGLLAAYTAGWLPGADSYENRVFVQGMALSSALAHGLIDYSLSTLYSVVLRTQAPLVGRLNKSEVPIPQLLIKLKQLLLTSILVIILQLVLKELPY